MDDGSALFPFPQLLLIDNHSFQSQYLAGKDYKGIVLLDDIYLNPSMDALWGSIGSSEGWQPCKYDVTDWGHSIAGTGLIDFGCRLAILGAS